MGGGGLLILFGCLYECWKGKNLPFKLRQPLVAAVIFIALGAGPLSQAFDWPHQDSHRTDLIDYLSLPIVFVGLALIIILNRAEKKAEADVGTTVTGEHTL